MKKCKTCKHWVDIGRHESEGMVVPYDIETGKPMERGFTVRVCKMPTQTFCEAPIERDGFGLADGSCYKAVLATAEDFGCVKHESNT